MKIPVEKKGELMLSLITVTAICNATAVRHAQQQTGFAAVHCWQLTGNLIKGCA